MTQAEFTAAKARVTGSCSTRKLRDLKELFDEDVLTEAEFAEAKAKVLSGT